MSLIYVLNGPNLNLLGKRQPEIYGHDTLRDVEALCVAAAGDHHIRFLQSNWEGQLIDWIHEARDHAVARADLADDFHLCGFGVPCRIFCGDDTLCLAKIGEFIAISNLVGHSSDGVVLLALLAHEDLSLSIRDHMHRSRW